MSEFWMKDAFGGADVFQIVGPVARRVKGQLEKLDAKTYSPVLKEFGITLWVDGSFEHSKEPSGINSVRVSPKKKEATFTLVMKEPTWKRGPDSIKKFFQTMLPMGFREIADRAAEKDISIDGDALVKDVERVLAKL